MKKIKMFFEAVVVIGIVLAFVMPGAAVVPINRQVAVEEVVIEESSKFPWIEILDKVRGWEEQNTSFWELHRGIDYVNCVDENVVWCIAYDGSGAQEKIKEFTKTSDGGVTWEANAMFGTPDDGELAMIFALDENTAWVPIFESTPQGIWKTSNGGSTWVHQDSADFNGDGAFPNIVHFWNENDGWCQGDPVDGYYEMYTTNDGGNTWIRVPEENIPPPLEPIEYGVTGYYDVVGDTVWWGTGWGYPLRVFKSTDRGLHWTVAEVPFEDGAEEEYVDVRFVDENKGMAMNRINEWPPTFAGTTDGGDTWEIIEYTGKAYNYAFDSVPGTNNMYVTTGVHTDVPEENGAAYSYDGGQSWNEFEEVEQIQLSNTGWVEGRIGWAGNFNGPDDPSVGGIYKYVPSGDADLDCVGSLDWSDVLAGSAQEGEFTVQNVGPGDTLLNWEIKFAPDWGNWEFDPDSGIELPGGESVIVKVNVTAPSEENKEFTGIVKVYNSDNLSDFDEVNVYLKTPRNRAINRPFLNFLQSHFNLFPILKLLFQRLGLQ